MFLKSMCKSDINISIVDGVDYGFFLSLTISTLNKDTFEQIFTHHKLIVDRSISLRLRLSNLSANNGKYKRVGKNGEKLESTR